MNKPAGNTSNRLWIGLAVVGLAGLIAAFFVFKPSAEGDQESEEGQGAASRGVADSAQNVVRAGWQIQKTAIHVPDDVDGFVTIKTQQVLRSPIFTAAKVSPEGLWQRLRFDPQVKAFLETSGIKMERGKRLSLVVRELASRPQSPHVVALWEGAFDPERVARTFRESVKATDLQLGPVKALGNDAVGCATDEVVMLGNRPLFDDFLLSKGNFAASPEVQKVLSNLKKEGAITAVFRMVQSSKVKAPMIPTELSSSGISSSIGSST